MKVKNVFLRHKGRKWPIITLEFNDGSTKSFTVRANLATAEHILNNIRQHIYLGTFVISDYFDDVTTPSIKLGEFKKRYKKHREKERNLNNISPNTFRLDMYTLQLFINILGNIDLIKINDSIIDEFIKNLKKTPTKRNKSYAPASINIYLNTLQSAFTWAMDQRLVSTNPFKDYPQQKIKKKERRHLSDDEISQLREYFATKNEWYLDAFNLTLILSHLAHICPTLPQ